MSHNSSNHSTSSQTTLLEILQAQYRCELTGLPHGGRGGELNISTEKLFQIKDAYIGDDPEAESFLGTYLESLKVCKQELEKLDVMTDEFCSSYLEALKPTQPPVDNESWDTTNSQDNSPLDSPADASTSTKRKSPSEQNGTKPATPTPSSNTTTVATSVIPQVPLSPIMGDASFSNKKRRGNLPKASTNLLKKWLFDHLFHPYPTEEEKSSLALQTGLSLNQISNWFINARRRILQPMLESVRQQQQMQGLDPPIQISTAKPNKKQQQQQQQHMSQMIEQQ